MRCYLMVAVMCVFLLGCATIPAEPIIGSRAWYHSRTQEIDRAVARGELTKEEELTLRNETDNIRLIYQRDTNRQAERHTNWRDILYK